MYMLGGRPTRPAAFDTVLVIYSYRHAVIGWLNNRTPVIVYSILEYFMSVME